IAQTQAGVHREQNRAQVALDNARAALEIVAHDARLIGAATRGYGFLNSTGSGNSTVPIYTVYDNYNNQGPDRLDLIVPSGIMLAPPAAALAGARPLSLPRLEPEAQQTPAAMPPATFGISPGDFVLLSNLMGVAPPSPPAVLSPASACAGSGPAAVLT